MAYVYRMYVGEEVKYIGYTSDMKSRMSSHFGRVANGAKMLTVEQAMSVTRVEYTDPGSSANARVLEAYLIARDKPEWNKDFVEDDELTYTLNTGEVVWKEWEPRMDDNPHHHIFVWKDDVLLYEIPKVHEVYDKLCAELGIEQDMNFGYSAPIIANGYRLMRLSGKRHIRTGKMKQTAKYSFMGYPEAWNGEYEDEDENDQTSE